MKLRHCDYCNKIIEDVHYVKAGFTYFNDGYLMDFCTGVCVKRFQDNQYNKKKTK